MASAPRFFVPAPLHVGALVQLPSGAARHVQVLRMQPGESITLFGAPPGAMGGDPDNPVLQELPGGEYEATITAMGRQDVTATVVRHHAVSREAPRRIVLAIGMPANERMDWLVEKATELGVFAIQPLMTERSVVRLDAARARKKTAHWSSIAIAACEQCGRNTVPLIHEAATLNDWLRASETSAAPRGSYCLLSFHSDATALRTLASQNSADLPAVTVLVGPEGGLGSQEESKAMGQGFAPVSLGARVLRAETAALAALTLLG